MATITGNIGRNALPVQFRDRMTDAASLSISLNDQSLDAAWRFTVSFQGREGGWQVIGSVDTVPPNRTPFRSANRVVAVASVPGATNWQVIATLLAGTPNPSLIGSTTVEAEVFLSASPEYAGNCCFLSPIPGNAVPSTGIGTQQTPRGAPPAGSVVLLFAGPGVALSADVTYLGAASAFAQIHDLGVSMAGPSTATMLGVGFPVDNVIAQTILLNFEPGRRFVNGYTVALSTTQNTYTASAETIAVFGQWSVP